MQLFPLKIFLYIICIPDPPWRVPVANQRKKTDIVEDCELYMKDQGMLEEETRGLNEVTGEGLI